MCTDTDRCGSLLLSLLGFVLLQVIQEEPHLDASGSHLELKVVDVVVEPHTEEHVLAQRSPVSLGP